MRALIATLLAVSTLLIITTASASARVRVDGGLQSMPDRHGYDPFRFQDDNVVSTRKFARHKQKIKVVKRQRSATRVAKATPTSTGSYETKIVEHPAGCPARAFCGCGAAIEVFGRNIRELWLAANWFKFPAAAPAPGMVAVRKHHVFVIREVLSGNRVLAYDANSGGRRTRVWVRSLAGYSVRNPRGSKYAAAGA